MVRARHWVYRTFYCRLAAILHNMRVAFGREKLERNVVWHASYHGVGWESLANCLLMSVQHILAGIDLDIDRVYSCKVKEL